MSQGRKGCFLVAAIGQLLFSVGSLKESKMALELPAQTYKGSIRAVTLGATATDGGTRTSTVTLGGSRGCRFCTTRGATPTRLPWP